MLSCGGTGHRGRLQATGSTGEPRKGGEALTPGASDRELTRDNEGLCRGEVLTPDASDCELTWDVALSRGEVLTPDVAEGELTWDNEGLCRGEVLTPGASELS